MYKFQIVDAFTKEILLEKDHASLNYISEIFRTNQNHMRKDCIITDNKNRILHCQYVSHSIVNSGNETVYTLFFKTKLENVNV